MQARQDHSVTQMNAAPNPQAPHRSEDLYNILSQPRLYAQYMYKMDASNTADHNVGTNYLCAFCSDDGNSDLHRRLASRNEDVDELERQNALLKDESSRHQARIADLSAQLSDAQAQAQVNASIGDTAVKDTTSREIASPAEGLSSAQLLRSALPASLSTSDLAQLMVMLSTEMALSMGLKP